MRCAILRLTRDRERAGKRPRAFPEQTLQQRALLVVSALRLTAKVRHNSRKNRWQIRSARRALIARLVLQRHRFMLSFQLLRATTYQQLVHKLCGARTSLHLIDRRRENIAASNGVRRVASHTSHAIFFDRALHDTHWPRFFGNLLSSHARCDSGGAFSTVSSCTSGVCRKPLLLHVLQLHVAFGNRTGVHGWTPGHHASNFLLVHIKSNIFRPAPNSARIQARLTFATSTGDGSASAAPHRTIATSSRRSRASS